MKRLVERAGVVAVVAMALAGCAGVPDSGPIKVGRPVAGAGGGLAEATVREVPAGPLPGASPEQLVSGFLRAMVDSDGGYGVARSYLAAGASWSADKGIIVFAEPSRVVRTDRNTVVVHARRVGVLGAHGVYRVDPGNVARRFAVTHRGGDWRISNLPPGVLLSSDDAGRVLQPAALYFLTPEGDRVVPQPVLESPQEPGLATTLMRGLLAGPNPLLAPGVRTAVPRGTSLVGNVPISADGVADVDLSAGARQISAQQLMRLSAQIVWTLRQLSSVSAVRLLSNGTPLEAPGVSSLQLVPSWPQFDPSRPVVSPGALLVREGRVVGLGASVPLALRGGRMVAASRSSDGVVAAAIRTEGARDDLYVGEAAGGRLHRAVHGVASRSLTFGPGNKVITVTSSGAVYAVPAAGAPKRVALGGSLAHAAIRGLAMSRDGTRVALVITTRAGNELELATVVRSGDQIAFRGFRLVLPPTSEVSGVAWANADQIVTTTSTRSGRGVVEVATDGYQTQDLSGAGLPSDVTDVAAAPGQHVLAADPNGTWQLAGQRWRKASDARAPGYAGG